MSTVFSKLRKRKKSDEIKYIRFQNNLLDGFPPVHLKWNKFLIIPAYVFQMPCILMLILETYNCNWYKYNWSASMKKLSGSFEQCNTKQTNKMQFLSLVFAIYCLGHHWFFWIGRCHNLRQGLTKWRSTKLWQHLCYEGRKYSWWTWVFWLLFWFFFFLSF